MQYVSILSTQIHQVRKYRWQMIFFLPFFFSSFLFLLLINVSIADRQQQFVYLAQSFLSHHLYFLQKPFTWEDTSVYHGKHYWPLGPFPAILLMPFAGFFSSPTFHLQGIVSFFLNCINMFLLYNIAVKITKNGITSLWVSWGYLFATAYGVLALMPFSWYFAQVVTTTLLLMGIYEYFFKRRWYIIGLTVACAVATRETTIFAILFYGFLLTVETKSLRAIVMPLIALLFPVFCSLTVLSVYNYLRFGNPFESGYATQIIFGPILATRAYGLWSVQHMPVNFFYLFLKGPNPVFIRGTNMLTYPYFAPDFDGMSIVLTSPIFLWLIKTPWKNQIVRAALVTSCITLVVLLGYYATGFPQYGFRYTLDVYPFLFVMLCYAVKERASSLFKVVSILAFLTNFYLACTTFLKVGK